MRILPIIMCLSYVLVLKVPSVGSVNYPVKLIMSDLDEEVSIEEVDTVVIESLIKGIDLVETEIKQLGFIEVKTENVQVSMKKFTRVSDLGEESLFLYPDHEQSGKEAVLELKYHVTLKDLEKKDIVSYYKRLNSFIETIYTGDRKIYSCGSFVFRDMIESDEFIFNITKTLNVTNLDQQADQDLHMMTGYTKQLKQYYLENTEKKNLQLASRVRNDGTVHVTIGTPILTTEY